MQEAKKFFRETFGNSPAQIAQAPGRLELLGNHTDYNEGLVMSIAVDRYVCMAASPRNDGKIELVSSAFPERETFFADRLETNPASAWTNYVKGVLLQLRQWGAHFTGFNAAIHGTLPIGAGMSSSAALEIATALVVRKLFPYSVSETGLRPAPRRGRDGELPTLDKAEKITLAKLCQAAESQFVGAHVGLLDQISSLFGKAGQVIQIDCRHLAITHDPMAPNVAIVVCNSGVKHALAEEGGGYNELRQHCESAARALGVPALRSMDARQLEAHKGKLSRREYECAYHIVGENQRVAAGERALRAGDIEQFGQFLFESHASSRDFFKNSCRELNILVDLAKAQPACVGARLTGGGFGGATINLVRSSEPGVLKSFMEAMSQQYEQETGLKMEPALCDIVDGAH
jgi:galactokinase